MKAATRSRWHRRCRRYLITAAPADLGYGYSRETEPITAEPVPVPARIELFFFTGRATRRAVA
ncbi:hypothetical protein AB0G04_24345 [Actinoplanes sp. NPDC023801]|uniref:hypothetical protein n=1 Tax=Actinoplanes sp. NPDC023801 TaxID=3154595 RepID=UPI0033E85AFC